MARKPFRLTPAQVDEVWSRRRAGQAVKVLAREVRVNATTVRDLLVRTVGLPQHHDVGGKFGCRWPSARRSRVAWQQGCRARHRGGLGSCAVDGESRGGREWRSSPVSSGSGGCCGVGSSGAAEAAQARLTGGVA